MTHQYMLSIAVDTHMMAPDIGMSISKYSSDTLTRHCTTLHYLLVWYTLTCINQYLLACSRHYTIS